MRNHTPQQSKLSKLVRYALACTLAGTGILISGCGGDDGGGGSGVVANDLLITNVFNDNLSACEYDPDNGTLSHCGTTGSDAGYNLPFGITVQDGNNNKTYAIVTNLKNDELISCVFNTGNGSVDASECATLSTSLMDTPVDVITTPQDNGTPQVLVTSNLTDNILTCEFDQSTGSFSNCASTGTNMDEPQGIGVQNGNNDTFVLVTNSPDSITTCTFDGTTGNLTSCSEDTGITSLDDPADIAFTEGNNNTIYALIPNDDSNEVTTCTFDQSNGSLSNCGTSGTNLDSPAGIVTRSDNGNTYALIANGNGDSITSCQVDQSNGELTSCSTTGSGFNGPAYIAFVSS